MTDPFFHRGRCVNQHAVHDRRATIVGDFVSANGIKDILRIDLTQTDVHTRAGRNRPREAPAIAVEHRQDPEVDRVLGHIPLENV